MHEKKFAFSTKIVYKVYWKSIYRILLVDNYDTYISGLIFSASLCLLTLSIEKL